MLISYRRHPHLFEVLQDEDLDQAASMVTDWMTEAHATEEAPPTQLADDELGLLQDAFGAPLLDAVPSPWGRAVAFLHCSAQAGPSLSVYLLPQARKENR